MPPLSISRRALFGAGAGLTLTIASGVVTASCAASQTSAAYAPWRLWRDPSLRGTPLALAAAGILAANPHDSQAWAFEVRADAIDVFADVARRLGAMDPFLREMHIGLGCALENMAIAAAANGFVAEIDPRPGALEPASVGKGFVHAATVRLRAADPGTAPAPAYEAIARRHTNRYAYDRAQGLPRAWQEGLDGFVDAADLRLFLFESGARRAAFDAVVNDATQAIIDDRIMMADSDRWLRRSNHDIDTYRSGPTLEAAGLSPLTLMMAKALPVSPETEHRAWLTHTRDDQVATAPLTGFIAVRNRLDRAASLAAGRVWQRIHLSATLAGVAMQPLNQPVEMVDRDRQLGRDPAWERRLAAVTGAPDWQPTFSFRAGVARHDAPLSPRRDLRAVVRSAR